MVVGVVQIPPCHEAKSSPAKWDATFEKIFHITTVDHEFYLMSIIAEDRMSPAKHKGKILTLCETFVFGSSKSQL